ncbi:MAG: multinuclear nonheme iron-dependent oxidase [Aggregatilineales bacterium]
MIALAVADKPLVRELLAAKQIVVDYLETTGPFVESAVAAFAPPMLLHNSLWDWSLAHPKALEEQRALEITQKALDLTRAPWFSIHLGFSAALVAYDQAMRPRSPQLSRADAFENIGRNIRLLVEAISVPLIIENLDYNPGGAYEFICEPAFIAEVLRQTQVGVLLDIAHARVSSTRLGCPLRDYLAELPLSQVKQIHISGPRWQGNTLVDAHEASLDEVYAILGEVLGQTKPSALTLEYARDGQVLVDQLQRLRALLHCR